MPAAEMISGTIIGEIITAMIAPRNGMCGWLRPMAANVPNDTESNVAIGATDAVDGIPVSSGTVTLTLDPPAGRTQRVSVLLNTAGGGPMYRLEAPPNNGAAANVAEVGDRIIGRREESAADSIEGVSAESSAPLVVEHVPCRSKGAIGRARDHPIDSTITVHVDEVAIGKAALRRRLDRRSAKSGRRAGRIEEKGRR